MTPDPGDNLKFGKRILELRRAKRMLQSDLITALATRGADIDVSYLSKIENGRVPPPSAKTITALAAALDANAEQLLDLAGQYDSHAVQDIARDMPEAASLLRRLGRREISADQIRAFLKNTGSPDKADDADQ